MTTYVYQTTTISGPDGAALPDAVGSGQITIVVPDGQTSLTLTYVPDNPASAVEMTLGYASPVYNVRSVFLGDVSDGLLGIQFLDVQWSYPAGIGSNILLSFDDEQGGLELTEAFVLTGDPLPFTTASDFADFLTGSTITPVSSMSGAFSPDTAFSLTAPQGFLFSTENDFIEGSAGDDSFDAGIGRDTLVGLEGDDTLSGGDGADQIDPGAGNDVIDGGAGSDTVSYGGVASPAGLIVDLTTGTIADPFGGIDTVSGVELFVGTGDGDSFTAADDPTASVSFTGMAGSDTFITNQSAVTLDYRGEADAGGTQGIIADLSVALQITDAFGAVDQVIGDPAAIIGTDLLGDNLAAGTTAMVLDGAGGNDTLTGRSAADTLLGGAGDDLILGGENGDQLEGGDGADTINAGFGFDSVRGGDGNDSVVGLNGYDTLIGDGGDDTLLGNFGFDSLLGEDGNDLLQGGIGSDTLSGGLGDDTLEGQAGTDQAVGGGGNDLVSGNAGADTLGGEEGADTLLGGINNDLLLGGGGNDALSGGNGADNLLGQAGNDILQGNAGDDRLDGGPGDDILRAGIGADVFQFGEGNDTIVDFQNNIDTLELDASLLSEADPVPEDLRGYTSLNGDGNLVISFAGGHSVTLNNITNTTALLDDVVFV